MGMIRWEVGPWVVDEGIAGYRETGGSERSAWLLRNALDYTMNALSMQNCSRPGFSQYPQPPTQNFQMQSSCAGHGFYGNGCYAGAVGPPPAGLNGGWAGAGGAVGAPLHGGWNGPAAYGP